MKPSKTKRLFPFLLAITLLGLGACGKDDDDDSSNPPQEEEEEPTPTPPTPTPRPTTVRMKCYKQVSTPQGTSYLQSHLITASGSARSLYECDGDDPALVSCSRVGSLRRVVFDTPEGRKYCFVRRSDPTAFVVCTGDDTDVINTPVGLLAGLTVTEEVDMVYYIYCQQRILNYLIP